MKRHTLRVIGIFSLQIIGLLSLLCLLAPAPSAARARPQAASSVTLEEIDLGLSNGQTLKGWYDDQLTHTGSITYFGAYITLPVTDTLYIGLGSARPAESNGAYFAKLITNTSPSLTGIDEPNEQGFHEMIYDGSLIHIAGTDPISPTDGWDAGNHYTYSLGSTDITKYRDATNGLKNVFHTWGLWKSGATLYAAVSSHAEGDNDKHMGQIFTSTNNGLTWTKKSDIGGYRAYDIIGFDGDLYAIYNDEYQGVLTMTKSTDSGAIWSDIITDSVRRVHLVEFDSQLIAVNFDREYLYTINITGTVTTHTLPTGYRVGATYSETAYTDYNVMAVAKGYLYLIAENQSPKEQAIIRTANLSSWERMVHTDTLMISLSYWANEDWLVVATPGTNAKLWKVDLSGSPTAIILRALQARAPASAWLPVGVVCLSLVFLWWKCRIISKSWEKSWSAAKISHEFHELTRKREKN